MPECPVSPQGKAGSITRTMQMLHFLNDTTGQNEVDFLSLREWWGTAWTPDAVSAFHETFPGINLMVRDYKIEWKKHPLKNWTHYRIPNLPTKVRKCLTKGSIDEMNSHIRPQMAKIVNAKRYDMVIISYATWGKGMIDLLAYKPYLILDSHDFITAQYASSGHKASEIGKVFQSEIDVLRKFDEIWTFSIEEKYIFEQFTEAKVVHIPISFPKKPLSSPKNTHKYDVVYVARDNIHNVRSVNWLLDSVLPEFRDDFKIHVAGSICGVLKDRKQDRIVLHGIVDDLQELYDHSRITICPMLSGTGVKIKVLESLSNNLPVVTNTRGVDGLAQKKNNGCLVADEPAAFAGHMERLLNDDAFYEKARQDAHKFMSENHDPEWERAFFRDKFSDPKPR